VFEVPNDSVSQLESVAREDGIQSYVKGYDYLWAGNVVPDLPADATVVVQDAYAFRDRGGLFSQIVIEALPGFVLLSDVVGGRSNDQLSVSGGDLAQEVQAVAEEQGYRGIWRVEA